MPEPIPVVTTPPPASGAPATPAVVTTPPPASGAPATPAAAPASGEMKPVVNADGTPKMGPDGKPLMAKVDTSAAADPNKPYKLKVNGKEIAVSLEELQILSQKGIGADAKFQEASKIRQQSEKLIRLLRTNPMAVLTNPNIGVDVKKLAQNYLANEINRELMTPEQRELMDTKEKLALAEQEKADAKKAEDDRRMAALVEHHNANYEKQIVEALQTAGLPKTRGTVRRMAYYLEQGLTHGVTLEAKDVVDLVKSDFVQEHNDLYGATDGDTLLRLLGDSTIQKLMAAQMKRIKDPNAPPAPPAPPATSESKNSEPPVKMDKDSWQKMMDDKNK